MRAFGKNLVMLNSVEKTAHVLGRGREPGGTGGA